MARQAEDREDRPPWEYGRFCFLIFPSDREESRIYCYADRVEVTPSGALILWHDNPKAGEVHPNLILPAGRWVYVDAVSSETGLSLAMDFGLRVGVRGPMARRGDSI